MNGTDGHRDSTLAWLIGPILLGCAAWFLWGPTPPDAPQTDRTVVDRTSLTTAPMRALPSDPPMITVGGYPKRCGDCHDLFTLSRDQPLVLSQHRNILQGHGMNDRCFNCHDGDDPSRLAMSDGSTVPFANTTQLCATCHGTTFRDWEAGMHGRATGSWDMGSPERGRLECNQCHDPHAPAFGHMSILPGPNTLRQGDPVTHHGSSGTRNPLRHWSDGHGEDGH